MRQNSAQRLIFNSLFESLEDRVLFDGVPDATFILPQADAQESVPAQVQNIEQADIEGPRELILVDAGVENSEQLLAEILESRPESALEIRLLDGNSDGVAQISAILAESDVDYDAIHIISHGDEGEIFLGNTALTADNLNRYADQLAGWSDALTGDADLLFYGCDLAGNAEGEQFIESISAITGADVAASDDLTGAAELGGDWDLELNVGTIETAALTAENWNHVLGSGVTVQPGDGSEFQTATATTDVFFVGNNTTAAGGAESGFNATVIGAGGTITSTSDFTNPTPASTAFTGGTFSIADDVAGDDPTLTLTTANGFQSGTAGNAVQIDPVSAGNGVVVTTITFDLTTPSNGFAVDIIDTFDVGGNQGDVTLEFFVDGVLQGFVSAPDMGPNLTTATYFDANGVALGTGTVGNGQENFFGVISSTNFSTVEIVHTSNGTGNGRDVFAVDSISLANVPIPEADLVTVKTLASGDATPNEGDTVSFDITVTNNGGDPATNVSLTDSLPAGITFTGSSTTPGTTYDQATGLFDIGTLNVGQSATLTLTGTVDVGEGGNTIINTTTAAMGDQSDPSTAGDDLDESIDVNQAVVNDKDWDGIPDDQDADADGDGILDVDESGFQAFSLVSNNFPSAPVAVNGGDAGNLASGDVFVVPGAFGNFDARIEFVDVTLNGNPGSTATADINNNGRLTIRGAGDNEVNFVAYELSVVESGSVTAGNLAGSVVPVVNAEVFIADIDARNNRQFSDVGGFDPTTSSTPDSVTVGAELEPTNSFAGTGAGNFDAFQLINFGTSEGSNTNPDFGVTFLFDNFQSGTFLHGVNGIDGDGNRGAVFSFSGQIVMDTDGDGIGNHCDIDSDNDGISDLLESGNALAIAADTDGSGVIDNAEAAAAGFTDADGDGAWDQLGAAPVDTDGDGIADYLDLDSDNDGIADAIEAQPTAGYQAPSIGSDADGDGVVDTFDDPSVVHGAAFTTPEDTDGDGVFDFLDTDSDNDGIDDTTESGLTPGADNDDDGIADNIAPNSYADPDGIINDPSTDLDNEVGDTSEVGYREVVADLITVKTLTSGDPTPDEGDTVTFQIEVTNDGNVDATNVSLTDSLPTGITFTNSTTTQGSYNAATGVFDIGTLNVGDIVTLTLEGTVDTGQGGNTITNIATAATGDQNDPTTAGDDLDEAVDVNVFSDKDGDGIVDSRDADADGDGILDSDEGVQESAITFGAPDVALNGADVNDIQPGDVFVYQNALTTADGTTYDVTITFDFFSPNITGDDFVRFQPANDAVNIRSFEPAEDDFITYTYGVVETGTATNANPAGTPVTFTSATAVIRDIDESEIAGFSGADTVVAGSALVPGTLATPPAGFTTFESGSDTENTNVLDPAQFVTGTFSNGSSISMLFGVNPFGGVSNRNNFLDLSISIPIDTDGDGIFDHCDVDSDNDGISDLLESGNAMAIAADTDGSGVIDNQEAAAAGFTDADGDGAWDQLGAAPVDTDGDGVADYLDLDSDNDGIADAVEAQPTVGYQSPAIGTDTDGDGAVDTFDDPSVVHGAAFDTPEDTDGDGTFDYLDTDSDDDGIDDTTESGLTPGADNDGDGIADNIAPNSYADTDGVISDPSTDLANETGDISEVGYREVVVDADLVTVKTLASSDATPDEGCLLYTSPSPRDGLLSRMPSSA